MASGGYRGRLEAESEFDIDYISQEEMASICEVGNEQNWLYCPEGINPTSYVNLREFLEIQSAADDNERLYRTILEQDSSKGGGIDTRTFTRPKKPSIYHPMPAVSEPAHNISFLPSGEVSSRYSFLSKSPLRRDMTGLKDVTNSAFDGSLDKTLTPRFSNFDDWNSTLGDQTMICDTSFHSFVSISDSDDGMSENIPNVPVNKSYSKSNESRDSISNKSYSKSDESRDSISNKRYSNTNESRDRRGNSLEKSPHTQIQFQPGFISTPAVRSMTTLSGSSLDMSSADSSIDGNVAPNGDVNQTINLPSNGPMNRTLNLEEEGEALRLKYSPPRSLQHSPAKVKMDRRTSNDGLNETFSTFRREKSASPKSTPKPSGLGRLSYTNTFRLSKSNEAQHFKSVESGLNSTFEMPARSPGKMGGASHSAEKTYSSIGNLPRSLGDVHLAAQQQEYQLRDDAVSIPSVKVPTLKSPLKKVLSETCIFSPTSDLKLRVASNHHGSVSNLNSNNNKDNNNQSGEFSSKMSSAGSKKNLASGLPVSTRPSASKPQSRIPSRLPTRLPTRMPRLQPGPPKNNSDWTEGCY